jgi:hypothetical protein
MPRRNFRRILPRTFPSTYSFTAVAPVTFHGMRRLALRLNAHSLGLLCGFPNFRAPVGLVLGTNNAHSTAASAVAGNRIRNIPLAARPARRPPCFGSPVSLHAYHRSVNGSARAPVPRFPAIWRSAQPSGKTTTPAPPGFRCDPRRAGARYAATEVMGAGWRGSVRLVTVRVPWLR